MSKCTLDLTQSMVSSWVYPRRQVTGSITYTLGVCYTRSVGTTVSLAAILVSDQDEATKRPALENSIVQSSVHRVEHDDLITRNVLEMIAW